MAFIRLTSECGTYIFSIPLREQLGTDVSVRSRFTRNELEQAVHYYSARRKAYLVTAGGAFAELAINQKPDGELWLDYSHAIDPAGDVIGDTSQAAELIGNARRKYKEAKND